MNIKLLATYATPLSDLSALIIANKAESKVESDARDARKGGLVDTLRLIATQTYNDAVPAQEASDMLRFALLMVTGEDGKPAIPGGTVKNYCSALRGYHKALSQGRDISEMTTAEANAEVASEEQKAIKAAREAFAKLTKKYTAAQWQELVALVTPAATETASDDETSEVEAEAKAA